MATEALLEQVAALREAQDAAGLKGLEDHADKQVRKAARRALHALRSQGVEIPDQGRSWNEASLQAMRRHAGPIANLELAAGQGFTRLTLSLPDEREGASLFVAHVGPDDRVFDFGAYYQTDGQQSRTARDWSRGSEGRRVDPEWVRARIRWAREATHRSNVPVPQRLDDALARLATADSGEHLPEPSERPTAAFLATALAEVEVEDEELGALLVERGALTWPALFDVNEPLSRFAARVEAAQSDEDKQSDEPPKLDEAERLEHIAEACRGDETLRASLAGPVANFLEDVAVDAWLDGSQRVAARVQRFVAELRAADEPETVDGAVALLDKQFTVAALRQMQRSGWGGGDANA